MPDGKPDEMCPLLDLETRLCRGYGVHDYYLQGCNVWPSVPEHTEDLAHCTYTWRWQED